MNTQQTFELLKELKLYGMASCYDVQLNQPAEKQVDAHTLIAMLSEAEAVNRIHQRTNLYLRLAKLRYSVLPEQIHCSHDRNLSKELLQLLSETAFVDNAENVLITGATGCGKSYLACALGRKACINGFKVIYHPMTRFIELVATSRLDGTYTKLLTTIEKTPLLILDDFGLQPLDIHMQLTLHQIMESRYKNYPVIITSQLPVKDWHTYIGEPTIADAIMDRLTVNAHRIELKGQSLRKK
jgi:DNA replication protein DnaC